MSTYWISLKNGDLRVQSKQPKARPFVAEDVKECEDFQHYHHLLTVYNGCGIVVRYQTLETYCGYDRGPKRERIIASLLEGL